MNRLIIYIVFASLTLSITKLSAQSFVSKMAIDIPVSHINQTPPLSSTTASATKKDAANRIADPKFSINLDNGWSYKCFASSDSDNMAYMAKSFEAKGWNKTTLPTKIVLSSNCTKLVYTTQIYVSQHWDFRQNFLQMPMIGAHYDLYINGMKVGSNSDSRHCAIFDITEAVEEGYNTLAVVCHNRHNYSMLEDNAVFSPQMEGNAYLYSTPKLRIEDYIVKSSFTNDYTVGNSQLDIIIRTHLLNQKEAKVQYELYNANGKLLQKDEKETKLELKDSCIVSFHSNIKDVELYSSLNPYIYYAIVTLIHENRPTQRIRVDIPFKELTSEEGNFMLNSHKTKLFGVVWQSKHSSLSDSLYAEKNKIALKEFKAEGFNAILLNRPERDIFYRMCDEVGISVIDHANIDITKGGKNKGIDGTIANKPVATEEFSRRVNFRQQRLKNSASIFALRGATGEGNGYALYESYLTLKHIAPNRIFAANGSDMEWNNDFIVLTDPASEQITQSNKSSIVIVVAEKNSFEHYFLMMIDNNIAGLFVKEESLSASKRHKELLRVAKLGDSKKSKGVFEVERINKTIDASMLCAGYGLYSGDHQVLCSNFDLNFDQSDKAIFTIDYNKIDTELKALKGSENAPQGKKLQLKVEVRCGNSVIESIEFEYKNK